MMVLVAHELPEGILPPLIDLLYVPLRRMSVSPERSMLIARSRVHRLAWVQYPELLPFEAA
jgi:hypothetical protein